MLLNAAILHTQADIFEQRWRSSQGTVDKPEDSPENERILSNTLRPELSDERVVGKGPEAEEASRFSLTVGLLSCAEQRSACQITGYN